jgi:hypothetical protein
MCPSSGESKEKYPTKPWEALPDEAFTESWEEGVHFSFRYVNSQFGGGVRLAAAAPLDLPYLCVQTIGAQNVEIDYCSSHNAMRQIKAIELGKLEETYHGAPSTSIAHIEWLLAQDLTHAEVRCDELPIRLRQIIVQKASGEDIVLTPLSSAGLFKTILDRLYPRKDEQQEDAEEDVESVSPNALQSEEMKAPAKRGVRRSFLNIGGSNRVNVGLMHLVSAVRRPVWFSAPRENNEIRRAYALYFQGVNLRVSGVALRDFAAWRRHVSLSVAAHLPMHRVDGDVQMNFVRDLVQPVIERAAAARTTLLAMQDVLPAAQVKPLLESLLKKDSAATVVSLVSPTLPRHMLALLDTNMRYAGWKDNCAYEIYMTLIGLQFRGKKGPESLGVNETEANGPWVELIKRML